MKAYWSGTREDDPPHTHNHKRLADGGELYQCMRAEPKVLKYGSYAKGNANPDSDIDVAVIVPTYGDRKFDIAQALWYDVDKVSLLIDPVLMAGDRWSPLYKDVMRTGVAV